MNRKKSVSINNEDHKFSTIIKVCTWNIQLGLHLKTILKTIVNTPDFNDLDFLALQETSIFEGKDNALEICQLLGKDFDNYQVKAQLLRGRVQANALIWNKKRVKVTAKRYLTLPFRMGHLRRFRPQNRICLEIDGILGHKFNFNFMVTHLDVIGLDLKKRQFEYVTRQILNKKTDLNLLAGDFNTFRVGRWPKWQNLSEIAKNSGLIDLTSEIKWTHQLKRLSWKQKLDAIFVAAKKDIEYESWTQKVPGSDHLPVFANIKLNE
jgi:endonuclease/exonuclease/phosphatase family metal-dependent hydrolase